MKHEALTYLIEGCRQQDPHCQRQLFIRMYDFGMSVAARYGRNLPETEEITNDGFLKMLRHINQYRPEVPFQLWLRRIIINCGIDHYRKVQVRERIRVAPPPPVRNEGEERLDSEYLLQLVRQLSPQYRLVFVLHVMEGFNHIEIAERLNISRGTSKSNLSKARQKLQEMLAIHQQNLAEYGQ